MKSIKHVLCCCAALSLLLAVSETNLSAQEKKADNSGTNPVNFTYDFRMWTEIEMLEGDNSYTKTTFEYRAPLSKKVAARIRGSRIDLSMGNGPIASTTTGFGDMDARLLWVPKASKKGALVLGLEATFNTASQPILGTGKTTLGPQAFVVFLQPLGIKGAILAPAYQYVFDIAGDDDRASVSRSAIDIFFVLLAADKKHWATINPTIIIDHENEKEFAIFEVEIGQMMFGPTSSYIRPGVGIGGDRPYEWNIEFGFKVIWK
jgi:hypothetical protein